MARCGHRCHSGSGQSSFPRRPSTEQPQRSRIYACDFRSARTGSDQPWFVGHFPPISREALGRGYRRGSAYSVWVRTVPKIIGEDGKRRGSGKTKKRIFGPCTDLLNNRLTKFVDESGRAPFEYFSLPTLAGRSWIINARHLFCKKSGRTATF